MLLPNQWSLRPAGKQVELGDFPINVAVHPGGRFAAVLHSGYSAHEILVVDIPAAKVVSRTGMHEAFYGLEFSKDGRQLFCSGAGDEVVHSFEFREGSLTNHHQIKLRDPTLRAVPAGLAVDAAGTRLFVANVWANRVTRVDLSREPTVTDILLGTNAAPLVAGAGSHGDDFDNEAANKREEASLYRPGTGDTFPYACRLDEQRQRLYVSLWAQAAVAVIDLKSGNGVARWPTQEHPCEMALTRSGKLLFVANASRNTVTVLDTESGKASETIWAALYPQAPPGSTPNSLALSPDEKTLFVANADNNIVAVFDVSTPGKSRSLGFIPVGWYPTSVRVTPDGKHLLVANGKGLTSKANPLGPQPGVNVSTDATVQYIARLFQGTLSIIDLPPRKQFERSSPATRRRPIAAARSSATRASRAPAPARQSHPAQPGEASPIKYCIYIIKENRTYDQVLGDMPQGNGDPKLCLFPERVTPNHAPARARVRAAGQLLRGRGSQRRRPRMEHGRLRDGFRREDVAAGLRAQPHEEVPLPGGGLFPHRLAGGRLPVGPRAGGGRELPQLRRVRDAARIHQRPLARRLPALRGHIDEWYRGFDLDYSDVKRADAVHRRTEALRSRGRHAAPANRAPAQRSHPRRQPRVAHADGLRRRQRPGARARSSRRSATRSSGRRPPSSSWKTTRRTARTTWMRTARPPLSSAPTRNAAWWIRPCIPPAACCARWN